MSGEHEQQRRPGSSPLTVEDGKIIQEHIFKEGTISVRIRKAIIAPDGEIRQVEITKDGQVIGLTASQALSLAKEINRRLG